MKRLLAALLAVMLVCSMSFPAFAAVYEKENNVTVKYVTALEGVYVAEVENGAAFISADDVSVSVTDAPSNAKTLVIIPMTGDALSWIKGCADGDTKAAYDIHFEDVLGNRINADGVNVSITAYGANLTVSSVNTSGADKSLSSTTAGGSVSFTTDGSHYYVISENVGAEQPPIPDTPQTGDNSMIKLWVITAILSAVMILFLASRKRRNQYMAK